MHKGRFLLTPVKNNSAHWKMFFGEGKKRKIWPLGKDLTPKEHSHHQNQSCEVIEIQVIEIHI